jgi:hypothetical protein
VRRTCASSLTVVALVALAACRKDAAPTSTAEPSAFASHADASLADASSARGPAAIVANAGERCDAGAEACTADGKRMLRCDGDPNGRYVLWNACTGPTGCRAPVLGEVPKPRCDRSVASIGEACAKGDENARSCAREGRDVLVCRDGTYRREKTCPPNMICFNGSGGLAEAMCTHGIP